MASEFLKDKRCEFCGADANTVLFGRILCGGDDCIDKARESHVCIGKSLRLEEEKGKDIQ
ncbi:MAG: hypothetical protein SVJ22_04510 [Halobacteriota archaeon]|nr:hypothetical protein [Halobacteriota archaeon]